MRRLILSTALLAASFASAGDLDEFLKNLNVQARLDQNGFQARVASQFHIGPVQVQAVLSNVKDPADAFMVFQLGQMTRLPHDRVLEVYKRNHHKGWGAMAKELGIKPGSAEFHALKRGDFRLEGGRHEGQQDDDKGHGKGKHKDKGHGRGHGKKG